MKFLLNIENRMYYTVFVSSVRLVTLQIRLTKTKSQAANMMVETAKIRKGVGRCAIHQCFIFLKEIHDGIIG